MGGPPTHDFATTRRALVSIKCCPCAGTSKSEVEASLSVLQDQRVVPGIDALAMWSVRHPSSACLNSAPRPELDPNEWTTRQTAADGRAVTDPANEFSTRDNAAWL